LVNTRKQINHLPTTEPAESQPIIEVFLSVNLADRRYESFERTNEDSGDLRRRPRVTFVGVYLTDPSSGFSELRHGNLTRAEKKTEGCDASKGCWLVWHGA